MGPRFTLSSPCPLISPWATAGDESPNESWDLNRRSRVCDMQLFVSWAASAAYWTGASPYFCVPWRRTPPWSIRGWRMGWWPRSPLWAPFRIWIDGSIARGDSTASSSTVRRWGVKGEEVVFYLTGYWLPSMYVLKRSWWVHPGAMWIILGVHMWKHFHRGLKDLHRSLKWTPQTSLPQSCYFIQSSQKPKSFCHLPMSANASSPACLWSTSITSVAMTVFFQDSDEQKAKTFGVQCLRFWWEDSFLLFGIKLHSDLKKKKVNSLFDLHTVSLILLVENKTVSIKKENETCRLKR